MSLRADFRSRGSWLQPPPPPHQTAPPERSIEGRGRSGRQGVPAGEREPLLPSTTMGILISSVCWLWEIVHVQVPLSCSRTGASDRLLRSSFLLSPGPLHCTEGLLPEGLSKVKVRLCPSSTRESELAVTVGGAGELCHKPTHTITSRRREEARKPRVLLCYLFVVSVAKLCLTLCDPMDYSPPGSSVHGISQARTRVGCHFFLQGIFPIQGSNLRLLHWQADSLPPSHLRICSYPCSNISLLATSSPSQGLLSPPAHLSSLSLSLLPLSPAFPPLHLLLAPRSLSRLPDPRPEAALRRHSGLSDRSSDC